MEMYDLQAQEASQKNILAEALAGGPNPSRERALSQENLAVDDPESQYGENEMTM